MKIDWDKPLFFEGKPVKFIGFSVYRYYYKDWTTKQPFRAIQREDELVMFCREDGTVDGVTPRVTNEEPARLPFSWDKPFMTKSGLKVELLRRLNNDKTPYPYLCIIHHDDGSETWATYTQEGTLYSGVENPLDLVNVPEEKVIKVLNYYPGGDFTSYCEREKADEGRGASCTHVITITERDGEPVPSVERVSPQ